MTRRNMMYLFYNLLNADTKDGQVYAQTLGYTLNDNDEIDYLSIVSDTMEGPVRRGERPVRHRFDRAGKTVYRNGYASSADAVQQYDVVYYNGSDHLGVCQRGDRHLSVRVAVCGVRRPR